MSFKIFKQNMLLYMQNQQGIDSYESFATRLTNEYDSLIRRGAQTVNNVPIQRGNKQLMEELMNLALLKGLQQREGLHDVLNDIGKSMVGYWTGATLSQIPTPLTPATGAVQNISTTSAVVTNPGKFPNLGPSIPTSDSEQFLNQLINGMKIHLLSIEGVYNTISIYPGAPVTPPAPGFLQWRGFQIPS
jgi:hypothetical protein